MISVNSANIISKIKFIIFNKLNRLFRLLEGKLKIKFHCPKKGSFFGTFEMLIIESCI